MLLLKKYVVSYKLIIRHIKKSSLSYRTNGNIHMINNRNVNIITDEEGNRIALIKDIRFRGKQNIDWRSVKAYLEGYMGDSYEISESAERVYIGKTLSDEFTGSEFTKSLKGANAKAKANAATAIPELIQIALNPKWQENKKEKHNEIAKYGWYRYDTRFALPVYDEYGEIERFNVFNASLLIRHALNGKKYLYDVTEIKKETGKCCQE